MDQGSIHVGSNPKLTLRVPKLTLSVGKVGSFGPEASLIRALGMLKRAF